METVNEIFTTKQYGNEQIRFPVDDLSKYQIRTDANLFSASAAGTSQTRSFENGAHELTLFDNQNNQAFTKRMFSTSLNGNEDYGRQLVEINNTRGQYISPPRKKRRRNPLDDLVANYSEVHNMSISTATFGISEEVLGEIYTKASSPENVQHGADARVDEVIKAAKSLFSKRTRTLYHWMHPDVPKDRIKAAVTSSWDCLGAQEKQFYISQVLGPFGFTQRNLMINPQLGGFMELPQIPEVAEYNDISTNELENAISSIAIDGNNVLITEPRNSFSETGRKKRLGRPPGSKNKKSKIGENFKSTINEDFQDDPELSEELHQFAMNLSIPQH